MSLVPRIRNAAGWLVPATLGQALNLVALAISVAFQLFDQIEKFVFIGAIASIATVVTTLNIQSVYPGLRSGPERHLLMASSLLLTMLAGTILAIASLVAPRTVGADLLWIAVYIAAGATNAMITAHLVFRGDAPGVALARLAAGVSNVLLTVGVVISRTDNDFALVATMSLALLTASVVMLMRGHNRVLVVVSCLRDPAGIRHAIRAHAAATGAGFLAGLAFHASSLVIPLLGAYSTAWATAIRVSGGISSIGVQILSPWIEATFGTAVRGTDARRLAKLRRAILWAAWVGGGACGVGVTLWVETTGILPGALGAQAAFLVGVTCYCISAVYFSVGSRLLVMSGGSKVGIGIFGAKALAAAGAIVALDGLLLIVALGVLELVTVMFYSRQLGVSARPEVMA